MPNTKRGVVVGAEIVGPGLQVTRDGTPLGRAAWGTLIPIDPGVHTVDATLPGKKPWHASVTIERSFHIRNRRPLRPTRDWL